MHLKFQFHPLNGSGEVAIINFEFNQISCFAGNPLKLGIMMQTKNCKLTHSGHKISMVVFSYLWCEVKKGEKICLQP